MAIAITTLISDIHRELDDPNLPTTANALRLINLARKEIAKDVKCFHDTLSISGSTSTNAYAMPSTMLKVDSIQFNVEDSRQRILPIDQDDYIKTDLSATSDRYGNYYEDGRTLRFVPVLNVNATTTTLDGSTTNSAKTLTLASITSLPTVGKGLIDSEKIYWFGVDTTNNQILNVLRAQEGTTASAHNSGATLTECNIQIDYYKIPADLTGSDSVEDIFDFFPEIITMWVCHRWKITDMDDVQATGSGQQASIFKGKYDELVSKMTEFIFQNQDTPLTVRRIR